MSKRDTSHSTMRKLRLVGVSFLSTALLLSACSSSSKKTSTNSPTTAATDSNAIPAAQAKLKALEVRPSQIPVTQPISGKIPTGKTIDFVVCGVPGCTVLTDPLTQAAAALGWKVVAIPGGLTPESILNAWNLAVQNHPDGVVGTGFPVSIFSSAVAKLNAQKIPAISAFVTDQSGSGTGLAAVVNGQPSYTKAGGALADFVLGTQGKSANALFLGGTTFPASKFEEDAFKTEYKALCPTCPVSSIEEPATLTGDALTASIVADLTRNPSINWVVASQPNDVYGLPAALKTAGLNTKILVNTPDATTLNYLQQGQIAGIMDVPNTDNMAQIIDAFARTYLGESVAPDEVAGGDWAVTQATANQVQYPYFLVPNYLDQYKKLWNV